MLSEKQKELIEILTQKRMRKNDIICVVTEVMENNQVDELLEHLNKFPNETPQDILRMTIG